MKTIKNNTEFEIATKRLDEIIDAKEGTKEYKELMELADLIEEYESKKLNVSDEEVSIASVIRFMMDQHDLKQTDLAKLLDVSTSTISQILNGKRELSKNQIFALHSHLKIPYEVLFGDVEGFQPANSDLSNVKVSKLATKLEEITRELNEVKHAIYSLTSKNNLKAG